MAWARRCLLGMRGSSLCPQYRCFPSAALYYPAVSYSLARHVQQQYHPSSNKMTLATEEGKELASESKENVLNKDDHHQESPNTATATTTTSEKVISAEELQNAAQRAEQEVEEKRELEQLLRTVLWRGFRSIVLFVLAMTAFFVVVKKKGSESRVMRYLQELSEKQKRKQVSEQDKAMKEAISKTEQLRKEMDESTWYVKDKKETGDIDPEFAVQQRKQLLEQQQQAKQQ